MSSEINTEVHPDEKIFLFALFLKLIRFRFLKRVFKLGYEVFFSISPDIPVDFSIVMRNSSLKKAFWSGILFGWIFCFAGTVVVTALSGTLIGNEPDRLYFLHDWQNIVNYLVICPLYLAFSFQLITAVIKGWPALTSIPLVPIQKFPLPRRSITFGMFIIIVVGILFTLNYINESIDSSVYSRIGWWVGEIGLGNERILGLVGTYYLILTFMLQTVCLAALFSYLSLFYATIRVGKAIAIEETFNAITFKSLSQSLASFTEAYLSVKLLTATLMLNAYTWKLERPEASINMVVLNSILAVFGVFIFSIPRYYIELEWFKFRLRRANANNELLSEYIREDLRPYRTRIIVHVVDTLIISGFILSIFDIL